MPLPRSLVLGISSPSWTPLARVFDIFSDEVGRHPPSSSIHSPWMGIKALDLNSRRLVPYGGVPGVLVVGRGKSGGNDRSMDFPPPPPRSGRGSGNRTLGLRAALSTFDGGAMLSRGGGRSDSLSYGSKRVGECRMWKLWSISR